MREEHFEGNLVLQTILVIVDAGALGKPDKMEIFQCCIRLQWHRFHSLRRSMSFPDSHPIGVRQIVPRLDGTLYLGSSPVCTLCTAQPRFIVVSSQTKISIKFKEYDSWTKGCQAVETTR